MDNIQPHWTYQKIEVGIVNKNSVEVGIVTKMTIVEIIIEKIYWNGNH